MTMAHAADCGLLAIAVSPVFGGLWLQSNMWDEVYRVISYRNREFRMKITKHHAVCTLVRHYGNYSQYDLFLPQLAAGKRIGGALQSINMKATRHDNDIVLNGSAFTPTEVQSPGLLFFRALMKDAACPMIAPLESASRIGRTNRGQVKYTFVNTRIPSYYVLDREAEPQRDTSLWEALRWNTAPLES
jgi:alkylation response protein AidB-like acyl-CoA dehydrogenase